MREDDETVLPSVTRNTSGNGSVNSIDEEIGLLTNVNESKNWEFAGWGSVTKIENLNTFSIQNAEDKLHISEDPTLTSSVAGNDTYIDFNDEEYTYGKDIGFTTKVINRLTSICRRKKPDEKKPIDHEAVKLGQWRATAIAGNDITSSCLYVAGIATIAAGKFAPLSLILVCAVLYLFRSVYTEVGSALPMNGGTYTVLLNTTTKTLGSLAACLTLLSYVATAVISASTASYYVETGIWSGVDKFVFAIGVLGLFAVLNLLGLSESANVALMIFIVHVLTLSLVCGFAIYNIFLDQSILSYNWKTKPIRNVPLDIFYGFCSGLLGVTGFETSANYIEEQREGVFAKTLRNMWISVAIFNPLISFLSLGILPVEIIVTPGVSSALLAKMGEVMQGRWLNLLVSIDAVMVLCGSVLTSYVGVTGLMRRMTLDRCLPQIFIAENPITKTPHFIILGFFAVTASLYAITYGDTETLAGVYAIAFLSVMALFAVGNMFLKYKRAQIPRDVKAYWITAIVALVAVLAGLIGSIFYDPDIVKYFSIYFVVTICMVFSMLLRIKILKIFLFFMKKNKLIKIGPLQRRLKKYIKNLQSQYPIIFFTRTDDLTHLNKAILYVRENEQTDSLKIVHIYETQQDVPQNLLTHVSVLDRIYPKIRIDLVLVQGKFSPHYVALLAKRLKIPQNYMFIACPGKTFPAKIGQYGGVRVITH
eukprot:TRINITY_DN11928_c0_g1_i1.p1 TRINITY_DN11928_c0_g1~~TRINITY_DN11928_c0_g1_i1.p1  ORF type:complete len:714 (+),score=99.71 TRINITY_DN11928_c0_g1_i1:30-2144(+)